MKLSGKVILGCLILSFALLFGGCERVSELISPTPSKTPTPENVEKNDSDEQSQQAKVNKLRTSFTEQEVQSAIQKYKCEKMTDDTLAAKKDPKDAKESPKTVAQCDDAATAKTQADQTKRDLAKAEQELTESLKSPVISNSSSFNWLTLALLGVAGVIGLTTLLGGLYFLLNGKIKTESKLTQEGFGTANKRFGEHGIIMNQLEKAAKLQQDKIDPLPVRIKELAGVVEELKGKIEILQFKVNEKSGDFTGGAAVPTISKQPVVRAEHQFPLAVEDFQNKAAHQEQKATADILGGRLVSDPSKNEEFFIVKDNILPDGMFYALPSFMRSQKKGEYYTYYENYYNCENPQGGMIWVMSPAIVQSIDGGWKLRQKGELEFR